MIKSAAPNGSQASGASDIADALARFDFFQLLGGESRALLQKNFIRKNLSRATAVLHKGQAISEAYLVLGGRLRVFTVASPTRRMTTPQAPMCAIPPALRTRRGAPRAA